MLTHVSAPLHSLLLRSQAAVRGLFPAPVPGPQVQYSHPRVLHTFGRTWNRLRTYLSGGKQPAVTNPPKPKNVQGCPMVPYDVQRRIHLASLPLQSATSHRSSPARTPCIRPTSLRCLENTKDIPCPFSAHHTQHTNQTCHLTSSSGNMLDAVGGGVHASLALGHMPLSRPWHGGVQPYGLTAAFPAPSTLSFPLNLQSPLIIIAKLEDVQVNWARGEWPL
jgi:hypothetical protein